MIKSKLVKRKYGDGSMVASFHWKQGCSLVWLAICCGKEVVEQGLRWAIGNGKKIRIYKDPWISELLLDSEVRIIDPGSDDEELHLDQLIGPSKEWDICKLKTVFSSNIVSRISGISIPKGDVQDQLTWHGVSMDRFSVRDAYSHCSDNVY